MIRFILAITVIAFSTFEPGFCEDRVQVRADAIMSPATVLAGETMTQVKLFPKDHVGKCYRYIIHNISLENGARSNPNREHYKRVKAICASSLDTVGYDFALVTSNYLAAELVMVKDEDVLCAVEILSDDTQPEEPVYYARLYAFVPVKKAAFGLASGAFDHAWRIDGSKDAELARVLLKNPKLPPSAGAQLKKHLVPE